ncbi:MAG: recombination protein RmuC [Bacteroidetes bacterium]|nr:recombination protein RmuC [Bacteroidota bacterium]
MEILFLIIGLVLGFVIAFLLFRNKNTAVADPSVQDAKFVALEKEKLVLSTTFANAEKEITRINLELKNLREQSALEITAERQKYTTELNTERERYIAELNTEKEKLSKAESRIARAEEIYKSQEDKYTTLKTDLENVHKKYSTEFEVIANKILDEKSLKFTEQNKSNMDIILNPLKDNIKRFEEQVQKSYKTESDERITLKTEIKNLIDLNKQISEEANNLTKALKGENKTQGNWGELILEKVLERSGLVKDQEYRLEYSTTNEEGSRIRPDAVIMLPDNKHIIVDAKVSLIGYEAFVNATNEEDSARYIKEHLASVRTHIKTLSEKNYSTSADFNTPDFVLLFIPIESSFSIAVQADQELFNFAWDKKIVIVSPSTLLATLRTIASVWKQERQTKNAIEIAKQSGALYDKFVGFLEDMDKLGKNMDASRTVYEAAMNKLYKGSGNLVKRAQDIEKLGAKASKKISTKYLETDEPPQLTEDVNN